ncbi:LETM1 domain-containing protein ylh47 [Ophidiomyces ophidiicola]|nr:LETM1 domain-containing protein ylh47 [Ophidiomyces ophidiicola]KAI1920705.1 LETM1 domain-containing protein ylh47 [Ophidiomyces ophidiicola]KAI1928558.1 LETM1 domain-containing protein ylh47 [Ophidiomyces ophidiicola]KAI1961250.1 LETM1 domain-containing protein ylh47 [Ophidiomyces ophidiicola]KAI2013140.1 LETM1 domain-containing protein ylh47 [Ophidiomyces ophidiicola]
MSLTNVARSTVPTQRVILRSRSRLASTLVAHSALNARLNGNQLPSRIPALAFLIPQQRWYATDPSTSHGPGAPHNFPPPGFNAEQAKKPLAKGAASQPSNASSSPATEATNAQALKPSEKKPKADGVKAVAKPEETSLSTEAAAKAVEEPKEPKKLTLGQKIKKEAQHYWDGTKLLATEVKISTRLAVKMAAGYELSRRENRQLERTVKDLGRLVPFSVFVIIPFAELLIPFVIKLFPNFLPSTYEAQKSKDAKAASLRDTRKEVSSFLRNTLKETGLPVSPTNAKREEFTEFFRKVRATGEDPSPEDVITVCKIFKDDLTLDNLSRPQLVGMCKYMNLNTFGTDAMLRYNIRHRMRQIKRDDRAISFEGVDSLLVTELQTACASRGLRTHGLSPARLREDLSMWLDLRLKKGVPSTLLVLSNAYMYTQQSQEYEISSQIDALKAVLSSIPEELFHEIELEVHNAEGVATNKQRLEVLKEQEELIEEENEQITENQEQGMSSPKDNQNIDEKEDKVAASGDSQHSSTQMAQESEAAEAEKDLSKQRKEKNME